MHWMKMDSSLVAQGCPARAFVEIRYPAQQGSLERKAISLPGHKIWLVGEVNAANCRPERRKVTGLCPPGTSVSSS